MSSFNKLCMEWCDLETECWSASGMKCDTRYSLLRFMRLFVQMCKHIECFLNENICKIRDVRCCWTSFRESEYNHFKSIFRL